MDNGNPSIRFFGKTYRLLVRTPKPEDIKSFLKQSDDSKASNCIAPVGSDTCFGKAEQSEASDEKCRNLALSYIMDLGNCRSLAEKQVLENELNEKVKRLYEISKRLTQ